MINTEINTTWETRLNMHTSTTTAPTLNQFHIHSNIFYSNLTNAGKHSGYGLINLIIHLV